MADVEMSEEEFARSEMVLRTTIATAMMQGMLAHPTRYQPRPEEIEMHWHDAMASEAVDLANALIVALVEYA